MTSHEPEYRIIVHSPLKGSGRMEFVINPNTCLQLLPNSSGNSRWLSSDDYSRPSRPHATPTPHYLTADYSKPTDSIFLAVGEKPEGLRLRTPSANTDPVWVNNIQVVANSAIDIFPGDVISTTDSLLTVAKGGHMGGADQPLTSNLSMSKMALGLLDQLGAFGGRITIIVMDGEQRNRQHPLDEHGKPFTIGTQSPQCDISLPCHNPTPLAPAILSLAMVRDESDGRERVQVVCNNLHCRLRARLNGRRWLWGHNRKLLAHGDVIALADFRFMVNNPWETRSYCNSPSATFSLPALVVRSLEHTAPKTGPAGGVAAVICTNLRRLIKPITGSQNKTWLLIIASIMAGLLSGLTILGILIYGVD